MRAPCKLHLITLSSQDEVPVVLSISDVHGSKCMIHYFAKTKSIRYLNQNHLSLFLQQQEYQLHKILISRQNHLHKPSAELHFVIIPDFYFLKNEDFAKYIVVNRRKDDLKVKIRERSLTGIPEIFSDGSYNVSKNQCGSACIIRKPDGEEHIIQVRTRHTGNNLAELYAVIKGIDYLKNEPVIRISTDSRYVIKGLAQWIHYWKINKWMTANCQPVKNIFFWKELDELTRYKIIELNWIKGHSLHFENTFCDLAAREAAHNVNPPGFTF